MAILYFSTYPVRDEELIQMRVSLNHLVFAFVLVASTNVSQAAIITEYTKGTVDPYGNTIVAPTSNLGLSINLAGLVTATIPNTNILPNGYEVVDSQLGPGNNGTIEILRGAMTLQNFNYTIKLGILGILGTITATGTNVGFSVHDAGPIQVTNGAFVINSFTPGELTINTGTLALVGKVLGNDVNSTIDFNTDPITQSFSNLGTGTIKGTATYSEVWGDPGDQL